MSRNSLLRIPTIILVFSFHQAFSAQSPTTIEGIVRDATTNEPLAGVGIGLSAAPPQATTNEQGRFSLTAVQPGRFRVVPAKTGYVYVRKEQTHSPAEPGVWVQIAPGTRIQDLELTMARPAVITGRVLDAAGRPALVGNAANVALGRYSYGTDGRRVMGPAPGISYPNGRNSMQRINDRGEFRFYDVPPGEYYLTVTGGGGPIGRGETFFYPGVTDETKARAISVKSGEDVNLGVVTIPPREQGVEVKFRLNESATSLSNGQYVLFIADAMMFRSSPDPSRYLVGSVAPGHYYVVISNSSSFGSSKLSYADATIEVGNANIDQEIVVKEGVVLTTTMLLESGSGERLAPPQSVRCQLRPTRTYAPPISCTSSRVVPTDYEIGFQGLPPDTYVLSVKSGEHDVLAEGLHITGDAQLDVVLASGGAIAQGTVRDAKSTPLPDATVAVVPDAPYRGAGPLYRSVTTDIEGKFEIRGIAPGSYKLFSWAELEGAAYRNADFMKEFEDRGKPVKVERGARVSIDLSAQ